jgi:hypothetical protein
MIPVRSTIRPYHDDNRIYVPAESIIPNPTSANSLMQWVAQGGLDRISERGSDSPEPLVSIKWYALLVRYPEVTTGRRNVVGSRSVGQRVIKMNALRSEGIEDRLNGGRILEEGTRRKSCYNSFSRSSLPMRSSCFKPNLGRPNEKGRAMRVVRRDLPDDAVEEGLSRHGTLSLVDSRCCLDNATRGSSEGGADCSTRR